MHLLTIDEHRLVVERLVELAKIQGVNINAKDFGYTSLMVCLLMHSRASAESLIALHARFGNEWFPITAGYVIVRSLFEVDVTAHYISRDSVERSTLTSNTSTCSTNRCWMPWCGTRIVRMLRGAKA